MKRHTHKHTHTVTPSQTAGIEDQQWDMDKIGQKAREGEREKEQRERKE